MQCLKPNKGHTLPDGTNKFGPHWSYPEFEIPCGYCDNCRTGKAKLNGFKSFTNTLYIEDSMFLTLTLNDENLTYTPSGLTTLTNTDVPPFIKRLRKFISNIDDREIGVLYNGEYGSEQETYRPHYHGIIYNFKFDDQKYIGDSKSGHPQYESPTLTRLWGKGRAVIGTVTPASCTYVASYIYKKQYGLNKKEHYKDRKPEFVVSPKKNFVKGREFIRQNIDTIAEQGCFKTIEGHAIGIDTHTLNWIKTWNPEAYKKIKNIKGEFSQIPLSAEERKIKLAHISAKKQLHER